MKQAVDAAVTMVVSSSGWGPVMDGFVPQLVFVEGQPPRLGEQWVDEYLRFTAARLRPNSVLAQAFDLKVFLECSRKNGDVVYAASSWMCLNPSSYSCGVK